MDVALPLIALRPPVVTPSSTGQTFDVLANRQTVGTALASGLSSTQIPCLVVSGGELTGDDWQLLEHHLSLALDGSVRQKNSAKKALRLAGRRHWLTSPKRRDKLAGFSSTNDS